MGTREQTLAWIATIEAAIEKAELESVAATVLGQNPMLYPPDTTTPIDAHPIYVGVRTAVTAYFAMELAERLNPPSAWTLAKRAAGFVPDEVKALAEMLRLLDLADPTYANALRALVQGEIIAKRGRR